MGTSVRKTTAKIKKLLQEATEKEPGLECEVIIPILTNETLRSKKTKNYFNHQDFIVVIGGGLASLGKISANGFKEYGYEPHEINNVSVQLILEAILDDIEKNGKEIESTLILDAFKVTMADLLLNKVLDLKAFLRLFCIKFLEMVVDEGISENLINAFNNKNRSDFEHNISKCIRDYVDAHFLEHIANFISNKITINQFILILQSELK